MHLGEWHEGDRRTGYMTLPLPVVGNLYAPTNLTGSTWDKPEDWKRAMDGRMILAPTMKQRGTPAVYWAVLWNRCLAIIDDHAHSEGNRNSTVGTAEGSNSGKNLRWGGQDAYLVKSNPTNGSYWVSSIHIDSDLDMYNSPYETMAVLGTDAFALKYLYQASLAMNANPVNEITTIHAGTNNLYGERYFPKDMTDPGLLRRHSLFARMRINPLDTTQHGSETQISNFNYSPSVSLCWNMGGDDGRACEIVNNIPGGSILGFWKFMSYDPTRESTGGTNEGDTFQNPPEYYTGMPTDEYIPKGGYYFKKWERPFLGIVDKFGEGWHGWDLSGDTTNTYVLNASGWTSASHVRWDNSTYTTIATIQIADRSAMQDPKLEIPRPISEDMKGTKFFSPYVNTMSWFQGEDNYAFRCGTHIVISDIKGNASTYNIGAALSNNNAVADDIPVYIRWYTSTGVQKTYSWTLAGGVTGDILYITQDYGSVLLVKAPFLWQTDGAGNVVEGNTTGGDLCWFAYFTD